MQSSLESITRFLITWWSIISPLLPRPLGLGDEPPMLMYEASDPLISIWLIRFAVFCTLLAGPGWVGTQKPLSQPRRSPGQKGVINITFVLRPWSPTGLPCCKTPNWDLVRNRKSNAVVPQSVPLKKLLPCLRNLTPCIPILKAWVTSLWMTFAR